MTQAADTGARLAGRYYVCRSCRRTPHSATFEIALLAGSDIYRGHFPGHPVCPGVCSIGVVQECVVSMVGHPLRLTAVRQCRFVHVMEPGKVQQLVVEVAVEENADGMAVEASIADGQRCYMTFRGQFSSACRTTSSL